MERPLGIRSWRGGFLCYPKGSEEPRAFMPKHGEGLLGKKDAVANHTGGCWDAEIRQGDQLKRMIAPESTFNGSASKVLHLFQNQFEVLLSKGG